MLDLGRLEPMTLALPPPSANLQTRVIFPPFFLPRVSFCPPHDVTCLALLSTLIIAVSLHWAESSVLPHPWPRVTRSNSSLSHETSFSQCLPTVTSSLPLYRNITNKQTCFLLPARIPWPFYLLVCLCVNPTIIPETQLKHYQCCERHQRSQIGDSHRWQYSRSLHCAGWTSYPHLMETLSVLHSAVTRRASSMAIQWKHIKEQVNSLARVCFFNLSLVCFQVPCNDCVLVMYK